MLQFIIRVLFRCEKILRINDSEYGKMKDELISRKKNELLLPEKRKVLK
jgi:hypothetical protein